MPVTYKIRRKSPGKRARDTKRLYNFVARKKEKKHCIEIPPIFSESKLNPNASPFTKTLPETSNVEHFSKPLSPKESKETPMPSEQHLSELSSTSSEQNTKSSILFKQHCAKLLSPSLSERHKQLSTSTDQEVPVAETSQGAIKNSEYPYYIKEKVDVDIETYSYSRQVEKPKALLTMNGTATVDDCVWEYVRTILKKNSSSAVDAISVYMVVPADEIHPREEYFIEDHNLELGTIPTLMIWPKVHLKFSWR